MTENELEILLDKETREMGSKMTYLNSCEAYDTNDVLVAMTYIYKRCRLLRYNDNYKNICSRLVAFMMSQGLAQLLVNIVTFSRRQSIVYHVRLVTGSIISVIVSKLVYTPTVANVVKNEFCKSGIVLALLKELEYFKDKKDIPERFLVSQILCVLGILFEVDLCVTDSNWEGRFMNTILKLFTEAEDDMTKLFSLHILAFTVNAKEHDRLATLDESLSTVVESLRITAQENKKRFYFRLIVGTGKNKKRHTVASPLLSQTHIINKLLTGNTMKKAMVQNGSVAIFTSILRPEYEMEVKQEIVEILWKLSSVDSCREAILVHLTCADTQALQGIVEIGHLTQETKVH